LQIRKTRIVTLTSTAVSECFEAFGNLVRKKQSEPNSATMRKRSQASPAEFIQPDDRRPELKKSQRRYEEFMKPIDRSEQRVSIVTDRSDGI
jgi:hypothetical protein